MKALLQFEEALSDLAVKQVGFVHPEACFQKEQLLSGDHHHGYLYPQNDLPKRICKLRAQKLISAPFQKSYHKICGGQAS